MPALFQQSVISPCVRAIHVAIVLPKQTLYANIFIGCDYRYNYWHWEFIVIAPRGGGDESLIASPTPPEPPNPAIKAGLCLHNHRMRRQAYGAFRLNISYFGGALPGLSRLHLHLYYRSSWLLSGAD